MPLRVSFFDSSYNLFATPSPLPSIMILEDMIIAHAYLTEFGDERINDLLDLLEDPNRPMTATTWVALYQFLKNLETEFGESHPTVLQVRAALSLPERIGSGAGVFRNPGVRIS